MAYDWNPNAPKALGLEQSVVGNLHALVDQYAKAYTIRWRAAVSAALDHVLLPAGPGSTSPSKDPGGVLGPWGMVIADLRPTAQEGVAAGAAAVISSHDASAVSGVTGWLGSGGGAAVIADIQTATGARWAKSTTAGDTIDVQFNTGAFSLTASQIVGVRFVIQAQAPLTAGLLSVEMIGGTGTILDFIATLVVPVAATEAGPTQYVVYGELWQSAAQDFSWIRGQSVRDMASAGSRKLRIRNAGPSDAEIQVSNVSVDIIGFAEARLAVGVARPIPGPAGIGKPVRDAAWVDLAMLKPDKSGAFSTVSGTDYSLIVRQPAPLSTFGDQAGVLAMRRLKGLPKFPRLTSAPATAYDSASTIPTYMPTVFAAASEDVTPAVRFQTGTVDRGESQPYISHAAAAVDATLAANSGQVMTASASGSFPLLQVDVSADLAPVADLKVKVRIEGGADVTAVATVTAAECDAAPVVGTLDTAINVAGDNTRTVEMHRVTVDFAAFGAVTPLVAATVYRVVFTANTFDFKPWMVAGAWMQPVSGGAEAQTFQAATGKAVGVPVLTYGWSDTADSTIHGDLMAVLATKPAGPNLFTAVIQDQPMTVGADCDPSDCLIDNLPFVAMGWNVPSPLSNDFGGFVIERYDALDGAWKTVGFITGDPLIAEQFTAFADYEGRLNLTSTYRVRSRRLFDGAVSDPTATVAVARTIEACVMAFVTNERAALNVAYTDVGERTPPRQYTFGEAERVVFHDLYGRDYPVAFRPPEKVGVSFQRVLLVNGLCTPPRPGVYGFDALRALAAADVSYVCVLDGQGGRFYATLAVPSGEHYVPAEQMLATIRVTEITGDPSQPTVAPDPVTGLPVQQRA